MSRREDGEEGLAPPEASRRVEDGAQSCVSVKSDWSMDRPIKLKDGQAAAGRVQPETPDPPEPSGVSMKSDWSMARPINLKDGQPAAGRIQQETESDPPEPSGVSMKSDWSMARPINFKDGQAAAESCASEWSMDRPINIKDGRAAAGGLQQQKSDRPDPSGVSVKSDWSMASPITFENRQNPERILPKRSKSAQHHQTHLDTAFMLLQENFFTYAKRELKRLQRCLTEDYPECLESEEVLDGEDDEQRSSGREAFLKIALLLLRRMKQEELADCLQSRADLSVRHLELKSSLKKKFQVVSEGISKTGNPTLLNQIYTELYITEGGTGEVNDEHEVRQIETASRKQNTPEATIKCDDIFKASPGRDQAVRVVMTKGVAGIGKTVLTQKFTLDWAEDKVNKDIHFTFPFTFRELNVLKEKKFTLVELIHHFFTETKGVAAYKFNKPQVVFIFDGLDECRLSLDFVNSEILTDATESTSVDVLLTNLIRGKLLPSARVWITTRPAAANQIPPECVDMMTEVRGFTDLQKEEYFRKKFRKTKQATSIIAHVKTSRSLHIMCHIPVFCWITATVLDTTQEGEGLPKTLTEMYIHFLVVQTKVRNVKYDRGDATGPHWTPESRQMIESLGKLAFTQLLKGNLIFYQPDLTECGIDIRAASVYSGVFTEVFKEESGLYQDKVYCFVHLSVQEFLAALHVHLTFINFDVNLLEEQQKTWWWPEVLGNKPTNFYQSAVDKALESPNGHLDLFLRFLLGLSLETNQKRLGGLLTKTGGSSDTSQKTIEYIKKKVSETLSPERSVNLFHCLNELNDDSLVEVIQEGLQSGNLSTDRLSPAQWSALSFILLSSEKDLDMFDLKKFNASEEALLRLLLVVKASSKALLSGCNLSEGSCKALSSVLSSESSTLRELDMSYNNLKDSGVKLLFPGPSPRCRLEILRLSQCDLTWVSCGTLSSVLSSQFSKMRQLDLSRNDLQESGVAQLCSGLKSPNCRLENVRLSDCNLSVRNCKGLSAVLSSQFSTLKKLDLSNNNLGDEGVSLLSNGLTPDCTLESLRLSYCKVTDEGFTALALALSSNPSHLRELDLSYNHPGESGVNLLNERVSDPHCSLDSLSVDHGGPERLEDGLKKYTCELKVDMNTISKKLRLSFDDTVVKHVQKYPKYPDHPDRFEWPRLLCEEPVNDRCYWEFGWTGTVDVSVGYRRGDGNGQSWSLSCSNHGYRVKDSMSETSISNLWFFSSPGGPLAKHLLSILTVPLILILLLILYSCIRCVSRRFLIMLIPPIPLVAMIGLLSYHHYNRVAVFVDHPAGTVSFYRVRFGNLSLLHTFKTTFTHPVYPGFVLHTLKSSVLLDRPRRNIMLTCLLQIYFGLAAHVWR